VPAAASAAFQRQREGQIRRQENILLRPAMLMNGIDNMTMQVISGRI